MKTFAYVGNVHVKNKPHKTITLHAFILFSPVYII